MMRLFQSQQQQQLVLALDTHLTHNSQKRRQKPTMANKKAEFSFSVSLFPIECFSAQANC
jgi:hypothetical protein